MELMNETNKLMYHVEKGLNVAGSLPLVGKYSGALRVVAGKAQYIGGAILFLSGSAGYVASQVTKSDVKPWIEVTAFGLEHMIQGALNILRGLGEFLIGAATFGMGNVVLLLPNMSQKDKFGPVIPYEKDRFHLMDEFENYNFVEALRGKLH